MSKSKPILKPELLAPAGSLEKLKTAILYGADAVYCAGEKFGLRTSADNFTDQELQQGVMFAHDRGAKVFVVLNGFLFDQDLAELPPFVKFLSEIKVDAVIVSDLGVIKTIQEHSSLPIHLSTQASCLNHMAAKLWRDLGVHRLILGREVSIRDAAIIKKKSGLEVEMFVHGAMCMSYSGNCTISNYTQGRDSNRGGCAQSCRFEYSFRENDFAVSSENITFMSSKDLLGIELIHEFMAAGIDSLKIEGRMKSPLYAGVLSKAYRMAIDQAYLGQFDKQACLTECLKVPHREYSQANLLTKADEHSIFSEREGENSGPMAINIGKVSAALPDKGLFVEVKSAFSPGDELEIIPFKGPMIPFKVDWIKTLSGREITKTKPSTFVQIPFIEGVEAECLVRRVEL